MFGAFSGFDTVEECYGDPDPPTSTEWRPALTSDPPRTGVSPPWTTGSPLLFSNSDAHSLKKLGREGNLSHLPPHLQPFPQGH